MYIFVLRIVLDCTVWMSINRGAHRFLPRQKPHDDTPSAQFRSTPKFVVRGEHQATTPRTPTRKGHRLDTDIISDAETNEYETETSDEDERERGTSHFDSSIQKTRRFVVRGEEGQVTALHYAKRYKPLPDTPEKGPAMQDFSPSKRKRGNYMAHGLAATTANWVANVQSIAASTSTYPYSYTLQSMERVDEVIVAKTENEIIILAGPKAGRNNRHNRTLQPGETIRIAEPVYVVTGTLSHLPCKLCVNWLRENSRF